MNLMLKTPTYKWS